MLNKILIFVLCGVFFCLTGFAQTIVPGGNVSGTWTAAGSPYLIQGNITIQADSTLTIQPGVEVNFQGSYTFTLNGFLQAVGTATDSILFTGNSWQGIAFENAPDSSHLTYCIVRDVVDWYSPLYGGITCMNSNPVISHSRISNNQGSSELWGAGGIMLYNSNADISWCNISGNAIDINFGGTGGGIKIRDSHPTITGCTISGNDGDYRGGGIDILGSSSLIISNCTITGNVLHPSTGGMGGGIASQGSALTVTECTISHNTGGTIGGGGIWISGGDAMIINCAINNNNTAAPTNAAGGGIYADCDTLVVDHGTFVDNFIGEPSNFVGFSIHAEGSTSLILINSIVKGRGFPDRLVGLFGASASITYSDFYLYRNAFVGNLPQGLGELTQVNANGDSCDVFYNNFLDPQFVDYANADYHLSWANWPTPDSTKSPCIDAGDPASPYDPDNTIADMGRYFFDQGTPVITISDSLLDFGEVLLGQQNNLPLTIRNVGLKTLRLDSIANQKPVFSHNWNPADSLILPGDSLTITVTFTPADTNLIIDTLLIKNNDKPLQVQLSGKGENVVGIEDQNELPKVYALYPAYPNPFNPVAHIRFDLPKSGEVQLIVYDILGRKVATLVNEKIPAGRHEVEWNASDYGSGLYFFQLTAGKFREVKKMLLVK